jgi:hypothetical protein
MSFSSIFLEYGGDFQLSPQGDLAIAIDTPSNPIASLQLLERILFTSPQQKDANGNVVAPGECLQYQTLGAGLKTYVDATMTPAKVKALQAAILDQMAQYPNFSTNPQPVVTVAITSPTSISIQIQFTTNTGQTVTSPAYPIYTGSN